MERQQPFIIHGEKDVINPVKDLISVLQDQISDKGIIVFLNGDVASGKTVFVRVFANAVGIQENIKSPTFTLMKSYDVESGVIPGLKKLVHIDAYRLEIKHKDALRVEDFLEEPGTVVFVEWPTVIELDLDLAFAVINFTVIKEEMRSVVIDYKKILS